MHFHTLLAAAVAMVVFSPTAQAVPIAGQISIGGYVAAVGSVSVDTATGLDFVNGPTGSYSPGMAGTISSYGAGYGSFSGLNCAGICGTIKDIVNFSTSAPIMSFLTLTSNGISFDVDSLTVTSRDSTAGSITVQALGTIHETGYDGTAGIFTLTAQSNNITSFSATTLATPVSEPMSLALLGGSLATVGLIRHKKRRT